MRRALANLPEGAFETPHGEIVGRVVDLYTGLRGQMRVCLVDRVGRVFHYDTDELTPVGDPSLVTARTSMFPEHIMVSIVKETA